MIGSSEHSLRMELLNFNANKTVNVLQTLFILTLYIVTFSILLFI